MTQVYIESSKIHVFPCANRLGSDESSKFTTEFNLSNLGLSGKSYLVEPAEVTTQLAKDTFVQCFVKGYYVAFLWPDVAAPDTTAAHYAYLQLNISAGEIEAGDTSVDKRSFVANQPKIVPFASEESLDVDGRFYGAKLVVNATQLPTSSNYCLIAANFDADETTFTASWKTTSQSYVLFSSSQLGAIDGKNLLSKSVDTDKLVDGINTSLGHIGQLKIGNTWYTVSVDGNTLNINPVSQASN